MVVKTGSFTSVVVVVVVTVSVTLPSELVVVDDVDSALTVVPVDSIFAEVFPSAAIGADVVVPFGATVVAVEAPLSVAEAVVPSVEDDAAPEALDSLEVPSEEEVLLPDSLEVPSDEEAPLPDSLEVPSEEDALLPDSLATPVFSFVPSARAVIGDAMTAALKVAAAIPISFE